MSPIISNGLRFCDKLALLNLTVNLCRILFYVTPTNSLLQLVPCLALKMNLSMNTEASYIKCNDILEKILA